MVVCVGCSAPNRLSAQFPKLTQTTRRMLGTEHQPPRPKDWDYYKHIQSYRGGEWNHTESIPPRRVPLLGDPSFELRGEEIQARRASEETLRRMAKEEEQMFRRDIEVTLASRVPG